MTPRAEPIARAMCRAEGTAQCAAICLSYFASATRDGQCPEATVVWGHKARAVATLPDPLLDAVRAALDTEETGPALVEVARAAHRAELVLARVLREAEEHEDVTETGGPNFAMEVAALIRGDRP